MSQIQKGIAVQWSISTGDTVAGTGVIRHTAQTLTKDAEMVEHRDPATGAVVGVTTFNRNETLELTVYPSGAMLETANNAAAAIPLAGENLTLSDSTNSQFNGIWHVERATINRAVGDKATFNVTLRRWAGVSSYNPITV
jgi:hypothetical protein